MSVGTERGWVGRIAVPQTGFPCGTTLVSVGTFVSIVSVGTLVSVVPVLKKTYRCKPLSLTVFRQPRIERRVVRPGTHKGPATPPRHPVPLHFGEPPHHRAVV